MGSSLSCLKPQTANNRPRTSASGESFDLCGRQKKINGKRLKSKKKSNVRLTIDDLRASSATKTLNEEPSCASDDIQSKSSPNVYGTIDELYPPLKTLPKGPACGESTDGGPLFQYAMDGRPKGCVFIINNFFPDDDKFQYRRGSSHDVGKLTQVFTELNFVVEPPKANLTAEEMKKFCHESATRDFSKNDCDCVVMVILTHGLKFGLLMGVDSRLVRLEELISPFYGDKSPTLIGKPKIFIIQACRGKTRGKPVIEPERRDAPSLSREESCDQETRGSGTDVHGKLEADNIEDDMTMFEEDVSSGFLPRNADIVVAFSTSENEEAFRHINKGSFYINELTKVLSQNLNSDQGRKKHFVEILTKVQGRMSNLTFKGGYVQMPEFRSTLRGPIYL